MLAAPGFRLAAQGAGGCLLSRQQRHVLLRARACMPTTATPFGTTTMTTTTRLHIPPRSQLNRCSLFNTKPLANSSQRSAFSVFTNPLLVQKRGRKYSPEKAPKIPDKDIKYERQTTAYTPTPFIPLAPAEDPIEDDKHWEEAETAQKRANKYVYGLIAAYIAVTCVSLYNVGNIGKWVGKIFDVDYEHPFFNTVARGQDRDKAVLMKFCSFANMDYLNSECNIFGGPAGERVFVDEFTGEEEVVKVQKKRGFGRDEFTWPMAFWQQCLPVLTHATLFHLTANAVGTFALVPSLIVILGARKVFLAGWLMAWCSGWTSILFEKFTNESLKQNWTVRQFYERYARLQYIAHNPPSEVKGTPAERLREGSERHVTEKKYRHMTDDEVFELRRLHSLLSYNVGASGVVSGMLGMHATLRTPIMLGLNQKLSAKPPAFLIFLFGFAAVAWWKGEPSEVGHSVHVGGALCGMALGVALRATRLRPLHQFKYVFTQRPAPGSY